MPGDSIEAYWKDWVSRDEDGVPFSFLSIDGSDGGGGDGNEGGNGNEDDEGDKGDDGRDLFSFLSNSSTDEDHTGKKIPTPPTPECPIDHGIPLPCQCATHALRTICLEKLTPRFGITGKTFLTLVKLVDTLEVSSILSTQPLL